MSEENSEKIEKIRDTSKIASIALIVVIVGFLILTFTTGHHRFTKKYLSEMKTEANLKYMEMTAGFNSEMALAKQMAKSPAIVAYMENPEDEELAKLGVEEIGSYQDSFASHITFWVCDSNLNYYSNGEYVYTLDRNDPSSSWYVNCMSMSEDYELNVDYDIGLKVTNVWVNAVVRDEKGQSIGLIGTGISLSSFVDKMFENLNPDFNMILYNSKYEITGSENLQYLEDKTAVTEVLPELADFNLTPVVETLCKSKKTDYYIYPLPALNWYIVIYKTMTPKILFKVSTFYLILTIAIAMFWTLVIVINYLVAPLSVLESTVRGIANGDADLTKRLKLRNDNSLKIIKKLVFSFNRFIESLQMIIANMKGSKDELVKAGNILKTGTTSTTDSIKDIFDDIVKFNNNLNQQSEGVEKTAETVERLYSNFETLQTSVETQSSGVVQASSAIEEMIANINSVNSSVEKLSESFISLEKESESGFEKQEIVGKKIDRIKEESEILQSANDIIASIAEQTNLLAMNAAIEAAHAGESGKGFSVVADEIRKLSETSTEQSNAIGEQLRTIQESIASISDASLASEESFSKVTKDIRSTNILVQEITNAMEEQAEGSHQISDALVSLNDSMVNVKNATAEMTESSKLIVNEMSNLQESTHNMITGMGEMNSSAAKINEEGKNLTDISFKVDRTIDSIGREIDQFKV